MDKTIEISLSGHTERFRLQPEAYDRLARYLDKAGARLRDDPDRAEVLGDLERSIGDKLVASLGSDERLITATDVDGVLEQIGAVDTGTDTGAEDDTARPRKRKLQRIKEGEQIAGVCTGLAAYTEIRVDWVRTVFILGAIFTAGLFIIPYIALAVILPVTPTRETAR